MGSGLFLGFFRQPRHVHPDLDLGAWGRVAFTPALVRDRGAESRREPGRSGPNQSGTAGKGGNHGFTPAGGAGYGQTEIPVYGEQEHSAYNGHFESTCYHPRLLFNGEGDCLAGRLRPGNMHSAEDWDEVLLERRISMQVIAS
jgi:hypothetical protein